MKIVLDVPDEFVPLLVGEKQVRSRAALEALAIDAYRMDRITGFQLRTLLNIPTSYELDGFLKHHAVPDADLCTGGSPCAFRPWERFGFSRTQGNTDSRIFQLRLDASARNAHLTPSRASSADERMARLLVARYRTTRSIARSKTACRSRRGRRRSTPSGNSSTVRTSRHEPPTSFRRLRRARPIPGMARARRASEARPRAALQTLPTLCRRGKGLSIV